ncbi:alpha/beta fold hydrolase [Dictyobacter formicarum]|uniref:AB hydrolase-1 domain-containing protein n=1 Tax=Dictyobacter formicarum TaxID=2778368 RepID=A0ABQ3VDX5_9CHLR|nr:alpha/beta hydrolase [Dictyobacter formicarum]GHO83959.1 hypothetical protein KSZ_19650 [Dictyobacter formicarum]
MPVKQILLAIDKQTAIEVFITGEQQPVLCTTHPFAPATGNTFSTLNTNSYLQALRRAAGTLVVVNPRGMGQSSPLKSPEDATLSCLVEDLEKVRIHLNIPRWNFIGGSSGGDVGLLYALSHPEALQSLIVCSTTANGPRMLEDEQSIASPNHPMWAQDIATFKAEAAKSGDQRTGYHWHNRRPGVWIYLKDNEPLMVAPLVGTQLTRQQAAEAMFATSSIAEQLHSITVPTLVLCGKNDPIIPCHHCEMLADIPHAQLVTFEQSGHDIADDEPDLFCSTIQRFCSLTHKPTKKG